MQISVLAEPELPDLNALQPPDNPDGAVAQWHDPVAQLTSAIGTLAVSKPEDIQQRKTAAEVSYRGMHE